LNAKPKGAIRINEIKEIKNEENLKFVLVMSVRKFKLKAEDYSSKDFWISSLK